MDCNLSENWERMKIGSLEVAQFSKCKQYIKELAWLDILTEHTQTCFTSKGTRRMIVTEIQNRKHIKCI